MYVAGMYACARLLARPCFTKRVDGWAVQALVTDETRVVRKPARVVDTLQSGPSGLGVFDGHGVALYLGVKRFGQYASAHSIATCGAKSCEREQMSELNAYRPTHP